MGCWNAVLCSSKQEGLPQDRCRPEEMPAFTDSSLTFQDLESCRLRLDPDLDRHRYERKISFAGVLDENEDSKDSLHSSSHTLKSDAGVEEKKGMEKQGLFHVIGFLVGYLVWDLVYRLVRPEKSEIAGSIQTVSIQWGRKPY